jgi:hypothetical protein
LLLHSGYQFRKASRNCRNNHIDPAVPRTKVRFLPGERGSVGRLRYDQNGVISVMHCILPSGRRIFPNISIGPVPSRLPAAWLNGCRYLGRVQFAGEADRCNLLLMLAV